MRRGDLVAVALQGDYGTPRPALVIQSDLFEGHPSVTILPVTSALRDAPLFRVGLAPSDANGIPKSSQVMVDKAATVARDKVRGAFGRIEPEVMARVERSLALFLGFAE